MGKPEIGAHTGSGIAPDNTMASFMEGIDSGADIVEVDVRVTKDGVGVLLHDDSPLLHTHTFAELSQPELLTQWNPELGNHPVVRLEDVLHVSKAYPVKLNLDIKSPKSIEATMRTVVELGAMDRVYITGSSVGIPKQYPGAQVIMNTPYLLTAEQESNYEEFMKQVCQKAVDGGYAGLNMHFVTCRKEIIDAAHALGLKVWVFTVNESEDMQRFVDLGVDAITTRRPEKLIQLLKVC
ncbi:glycerophosphodiester phosphodiesterase [Paenibacillus pasadenensis]|uniref:glycerophosphodiester phosphodiesterase n=1 Tax=Paenibacillus pasadenensis TaxID=217090 RepID=UPI00204216C0|nr:glycerophosphodiester phosphodiesterase [Paenibacillus pasadenensis]MCM3746590.1 glycerophosphodiester phosphodiesterase [Paenibacillus pasadenensis]